MTLEQVQLGRMVRVVATRWDAPLGTLAKIDTIGSTADRWCFTVEWLTRNSPLRRSYSLNLFEEDLPHFEVFAGPVPERPSSKKPSHLSSTRKERPLQLPLPFTADHTDLWV